MDFTLIREISIDLHGLSQSDMNKNYNFYYDETNNPRVYKLTEKGFNFDEKAYFILGGLVFNKDETPRKELVSVLFKNLEVQSNMKEVKFNHVREKSATFLNLLEKKRAQIFIDWIFTHEYWVHFYYRDNFYYSIVDIIDSIEMSSYGGVKFNRELKSVFYESIKSDKKRFISLLKEHDYPNVTQQFKFVNTLLDWIEELNSKENFEMGYIKQSLKSYRKKSLVFLENNKDLITIESYKDIYLNSIFLYTKARHIFDEEKVIEREISSIEIEISGKKLNNYQFIDSEDCELVQLSDVTVGILRMWMGYIEEKEIEELENDFLELNDSQRKTIVQLQKILNNSIEENIAFKSGSGSNIFERKITFFLEYNFRK